MKRRALTYAALAMLFALPARPQYEVSLQWIPEQETLYLGESMELSLIFDGAEEATAPDLPRFDDFELRLLRGVGTRSNGRPAYVFQYDIIPRRSGTLIVPAVEIQHGERSLRANAITIPVRAPEETNTMRLTTALSKTQCYAGESLTLTVTWYCAMPLQTVKAVDLRVPFLRDARVRVLVPADQPDPAAEEAVGVPVNGTRVIAMRGETTIDGTRYATLTFSRRIVPREAGTFAVEGTEVFCAALDQSTRARRSWNQYPSYFDNDFFDKDLDEAHDRLFAKGAPLQLEVLPLPTAGAPERFQGLVAEACRIETTLDRGTAAVGAPLELTVTLHAEAGIEHATAPVLSQQPALARDFEVPSALPLGIREAGAVHFTYTVRPRHTDVAALPAIGVEYFDPAREAYAATQSQALPLAVTAARQVSARDAEAAGEAGMAGGLADRDAPLLQVRATPDLLADRRGTFFGLGGVLFWLAALVLPPLPFLWITARRAWLRHNAVHPEVARARQAHSAFQRSIQKAPHPEKGRREAAYTGIEHALRSYLADKLGLSAKSLTYPDAEPPLEARAVDETLLARLRRVFDHCLANRFSGGRHEGRAHNDDMAEARETIRELEEKLR